MKFGVCRGLDDFDAIKAAKKAGVDYFECGFGNLATYDDEKFKQCKDLLESLDFKCIAANGFIPGNLKLVGDSVDYDALGEYLDKGFERAEALGVKKIVLGSGAARSFEEGYSFDKAKEQLAFFLSEYASPRAKKTNSIIVLEPLRFQESTMIHTVADGVEIAKMSGADNVFGLADLYHVYGNNDSISGMYEFRNLVRHAHIAEPVDRKYPSKNDDELKIYIYTEFLRTLKAIGCDTCSIEARTDNFEEDIFNAISLVKSLDL